MITKQKIPIAESDGLDWVFLFFFSSAVRVLRRTSARKLPRRRRKPRRFKTICFYHCVFTRSFISVSISRLDIGIVVCV